MNISTILQYINLIISNVRCANFKKLNVAGYIISSIAAEYNSKHCIASMGQVQTSERFD